MRIETRPAQAEPPEEAVSPRRAAWPGWPRRALARLRADWRAEDTGRPAWQAWFWTALLAALLVGYAVALGALDWYTAYPAELPDGRTILLPHTFSSIDHPFHIAKERATVEALRAGRLPQWFSNHQGGFPAEFYPTGGDLLVAFAYFLALERIPLAVVHKLVVIGVLLLPPLAYWAFARRERLPLSVALLAALLHLFVRGNWLAGGSREIVDYGLWPDTLASYLPLFLILWGADWLRRGERRGLVLAVAAATLAIYTNPRATLGLAAAGLALGVVALSELHRVRAAPPPGARPAHDAARANAQSARLRHRVGSAARSPFTVLMGRSALLATLVGLLSSALLLPLRANQGLYTFTIYVRFESARQTWTNPDTANGVGYVESVLPPLIALAGIGLVVGLVRRGFYTRVFALLLPLSYLIMTLVGWTWRDLPVFAQLEGPRLMPMLRPATIFLAALGAHEALRLVVRLLRLRGGTMLAGAAVVAVAAILLFAPSSPLGLHERGLPLRETTDQPNFTAIARSAAILDAAAGPNDKPLIIGNPISWHASFWIPALTGRNVFHSDWLWFWRTTDYGYQELLQDERGALATDFLARHGLTMVLIDTGRWELLDLADSLPHLRRLDTGTPGGYALYRVASPPGAANGYIVPESGKVTALTVRPDRLEARITSDRAGAARVIVNDFPRWRALVNGRAVPLGRTTDGYIALPVPQGEATVELRYVAGAANWLGRGLVALGLLLMLGCVAGPWTRRRLRRP